jgi:hypothetical protein
VLIKFLICFLNSRCFPRDIYVYLYNSECTGSPTEFDIVLHDDLRYISMSWNEVTFDRGVTGYQVQAKPLAAQGAAEDDDTPNQNIEVRVSALIQQQENSKVHLFYFPLTFTLRFTTDQVLQWM